MITPYPTTTLTNLETNVYLADTSYSYPSPIGNNPLELQNPSGYGPKQVINNFYPQNSTQVETAGMAMLVLFPFFEILITDHTKENPLQPSMYTQP